MRRVDPGSRETPLSQRKSVDADGRPRNLGNLFRKPPSTELCPLASGHEGIRYFFGGRDRDRTCDPFHVKRNQCAIN
jgi:hypothetical protein